MVCQCASTLQVLLHTCTVPAASALPQLPRHGTWASTACILHTCTKTSGMHRWAVTLGHQDTHAGLAPAVKRRTRYRSCRAPSQNADIFLAATAAQGQPKDKLLAHQGTPGPPAAAAAADDAGPAANDHAILAAASAARRGRASLPRTRRERSKLLCWLMHKRPSQVLLSRKFAETNSANTSWSCLNACISLTEQHTRYCVRFAALCVRWASLPTALPEKALGLCPRASHCCHQQSSKKSVFSFLPLQCSGAVAGVETAGLVTTWAPRD